MGRSSVTERKPIQAPDPSRQIRFHDLLVVARKTWLLDALNEALSVADPTEIKRQISRYAPADVQRTLAAAGIRDEHVFPTPLLLEAQPSLVGYYRLLVGVPQKTFYRSGTGMGIFRRMEAAGTINAASRAALRNFVWQWERHWRSCSSTIARHYAPRRSRITAPHPWIAASGWA